MNKIYFHKEMLFIPIDRELAAKIAGNTPLSAQYYIEVSNGVVVYNVYTQEMMNKIHLDSIDAIKLHAVIKQK